MPDSDAKWSPVVDRADEDSSARDAHPTVSLPAEAVPHEEPIVGPGSTLGPYRLDTLLGQGGAASVFLATHVTMGRKVAIKVLDTGASTSLRNPTRFFAEARAVARIGSPYIVDVFDFVDDPGGPTFMVMELLEGEDLNDRLDREGTLSCEEAIQIAGQMLHGIKAAHEAGVLHRDLKPANVFLAVPGRVKLLDFGVAKLLDSGEMNLTTPGLVFGTPHYMAPEQVRGKPLTPTADIYAFGCIFYQMLAGRTPFIGDESVEVFRQLLDDPAPSPTSFRPSDRDPIAPAIDAFIMRCLEKDPDKRPQTADEALALLASAHLGEEIASPRAQLRRVRLAIAGVAFFVLASVGTWLGLRESPRIDGVDSIPIRVAPVAVPASPVPATSPDASVTAEPAPSEKTSEPAPKRRARRFPTRRQAKAQEELQSGTMDPFK